VDTSQAPGDQVIPALDKTDVARAKEAALVASINRKAKIATIEDWVVFIATKVLGLSGMIIGGVSVLRPGVLPLTSNQALYVLSGGIALLVGKKVIAQLARLNS